MVIACLQHTRQLVIGNYRLVGIWRSEHGGKAIFPTIPKFTYGEEIRISLSDNHLTALPALNYT
jgi:hypothetical protein